MSVVEKELSQLDQPKRRWLRLCGAFVTVCKGLNLRPAWLLRWVLCPGS